MNAVEMQSLRRICGVSLADRIRNEEIHRMAGTRMAGEDVTVRMKKNMLSWFGHVERMSDERMAKEIYDGKVSGKRGRRRSRLTFENSIKDTGGRSRKNPPEGMYKEIHDNGRGERGM